MKKNSQYPVPQGLYDPQNEHEACGIGFIVDIKGRPSHELVATGIRSLHRLDHRGACGCEENTGDGAGILIQMPHEFLARVTKAAKIALPPLGQYGAGCVFLPQQESSNKEIKALVQKIIEEEGQTFLGWRKVPTQNKNLGKTAKSAEPKIEQLFIGRSTNMSQELAFERKLYVIRRRIESEVQKGNLEGKEFFYIASLSYKTLVYKGMLTTGQLPEYFLDLKEKDLKSAIVLFHSRFSTNTFPSWKRAHPYRYIVHNGEINTLRGNVHWMKAREAHFDSNLFEDDLPKVVPVIDPDGSDSAMFDNCLEFLVLAGRSVEETLMMMIPEPWSKHESMSDEVKAFYEFHHSIMEPWDGPASIAFSDGVKVGAVLDRNGLRPSRYSVTKSGWVVMASEAGVADIPPEDLLRTGRVEPGRMLLIDTSRGEIIDDDQIKKSVAARNPYSLWLKDHLTSLNDLSEGEVEEHLDKKSRNHYQQLFGYTREDLNWIIAPMAQSGVEAVGSMGNDAPIAPLSQRPQLLFNYFKQLFAQVTNPPVDPIREEIIMAADVRIGPERNLLDTKPGSCHQIRLDTPILSNEELAKIVAIKRRSGFESVRIPIFYNVEERGEGLQRGLKKLFERATRAIAKGANILILSDRNPDPDRAPIPSLLAVSALHHYLLREGLRTKVGLILESAEPREVHHFAVLIGYGASAVNPYLALESIHDLMDEGLVSGIDYEKAKKNYLKAASKGVVKVISKMGISTIRSYCGAQIFECVGLSQEVVDKYFTWTPSRVGGLNLAEIEREIHERFSQTKPETEVPLDSGGQYQWRAQSEVHLFNPTTVHKLQASVRQKRYDLFKEYSTWIDEQNQHLCTLRGLLKFNDKHPKSISIDKVESIESILKRFKTGAMSYGSISQEAHEALAIAMNRIGAKSNTGEGGEDPARYTPLPNGDSKNSAIKQVASGRFGVTSNYLVNAQEIQIKIAQGAKPGEGGQLPGLKVFPWIAEVRHSTPGVGLISPPPHHDIYSIEDLAELIHDLKNANPRAKITVKLVAAAGVGTIAAGVAKARADLVLIAGFDGGTGASPLTSIKHAGMPWEMGLSETHQTLLLNDLRSRITVEVDGQLRTGRDVVIGALLGAEEFGFGTAPLVALGCIIMRVCHKNTCPVGVATQDPKLRARFKGDPDHVVQFMKFVAQEVREIMAYLGVRKFEDLIGRTDWLERKSQEELGEKNWKVRGIDLSGILYQPAIAKNVGRFKSMEQDHGIERSLDFTTLLPKAKEALTNKRSLKIETKINNVNRVVGTLLGSELTRLHGPKGLAPGTIEIHCRGTAGQSFGAFVPRGISLFLEGESNDYLGKGLSGGTIIQFPDRDSTYKAEENVATGNVALYGATSGEVYIRGIAGERFCVRNSGATAVVEGVGDHGCEYMTGGRVVVLGASGRNFAAGMSGGIAYVLDHFRDFDSRCNREMVDLFPIEVGTPEETELKSLIEKHFNHTQSERAKEILDQWETYRSQFKQVLPRDYNRMVRIIEAKKALGLADQEAAMAAFEENARDLARVGGS